MAVVWIAFTNKQDCAVQSILKRTDTYGSVWVVVLACCLNATLVRPHSI